MGDVLDALSNGIAKTAVNEPKFEPNQVGLGLLDLYGIC